jgi:hypothetical protein
MNSNVKQFCKNPHIQSATVAQLALNVLELEDDEHAERSTLIYEECCSKLGMPPEGRKVSGKQRVQCDRVLETILEGATRMRQILAKARLLSN